MVEVRMDFPPQIFKYFTIGRKEINDVSNDARSCFRCCYSVNIGNNSATTTSSFLQYQMTIKMLFLSNSC